MVAKRKIALAQNFLKRSYMAASLIEESSIDSSDIVYEIGPGTGIITEELSKRAKKVIAIEKDIFLYNKLKKQFKCSKNVILNNADILEFTIRGSRYKIFANIPFNITSAIARKILHSKYPPDEAYLIMQKEAANKCIGVPKTSQFSILVKPWFTFMTTRVFNKTDFSPAPSVDVVMLHIAKRSPSLIRYEEKSTYEGFVKFGFNAWRKNLRSSYKKFFSYNQWKRLSRDLHFAFHAKPSDLSFMQWLGLYNFYRKSLFEVQTEPARKLETTALPPITTAE